MIIPILTEDNRIIKKKVPKEKVMKEIEEILERDKDFLEIMEKL